MRPQPKVADGFRPGRLLRRRSALLLLLALLIPGGCAAPQPTSTQTHQHAKSIYVVSHGWHTSIVVQRTDIPDHLWPEHRDLPAATYIEVGWGDQAFYQAAKASIGLVLKAALQATPSVLHIAWFDTPVAHYFPASDIIEVGLSQSGFERLSIFIHETYTQDEPGKTVHLGPGLYRQSVFYQARGTYHLFNTCNNWTAQALQAAGRPIAPARAMTAGSVMAQTRKFGRTLRSKPEP